MKLKSLFKRETVLKRTASLLLVGAAAVAFQGVAYAHNPVIAATATCSNGVAVINYTVTSWSPGTLSGSIVGVDVTFNGAVVDTGALALPLDTFSGTMPAPLATTTVDVQALPASPFIWGDGQVSSTPSNIVTLTIPTNCSTGTGRFTGGGKDAIAGGVTITKGFEVDCDLHQPSNNLEINWTGGNHFHMENFYSAVCTLQGNPRPPKAPVNTIVGMGTGRYDGLEGYTVVFELQDNGEPGTNDKTSFLIYETANPANVVLNLPLSIITSGNIQAHVDQH
jgi:hypothetical protein